MATYIYQVRDDAGRRLHGVMEASNKKQVKQKLANTKYFYVKSYTIQRKSLFKLNVKLNGLIMFTHRLSSLIEAGVPILTGMQILWRQSEDKNIQLIVSYIQNELEEGSQISDAMDNFPHVFPLVYRSLIRVGEKSGALVQVLQRMCEYLDYRARMIARIKKASLYPIIVIFIAMTVMIFMYLFVVPAFKRMFETLEGELPAITQVVMGLADAMRTPIFWGGVLVTVIVGFIIFKVLKANKNFGAVIDRLKIKMPYLGRIMATINVAMFVRSLGIMLEAGVPVIESLEVSKTTIRNQYLQSQVNQIKADIEQGMGLYDAFNDAKGFPILLNEMIGVGESSGMIVPMLQKLTVHFDEEVDYHLNKFLTILEPLLILLVGGIVVLTLLSIYLPIASLWDKLS